MGATNKKKWFKPSDTHTGWSKDLGVTKRRDLALKAHKKDKLATARSLMALSNVTRDSETKRLAKKDALYFYRLYKG